MIDPQLEDWWSNRRLTEIRYHHPALSGAGVSLRVILPAFRELGLTWYSKMYGEYDDNVLLLGCDRNVAAELERVAYTGQSPVKALCECDLPDEYELTDGICAALGIRLDGNSFAVDREDRVALQVYIHDNCFFYVSPVEDALLGSLLGCILEQHSFYLGQEVDWSGVSPEIERRLRAVEGIELQSDPEKRCMWIPQLEKRRWPFWRRFRQGTVWVEDGKARFRAGLAVEEVEGAGRVL